MPGHKTGTREEGQAAREELAQFGVDAAPLGSPAEVEAIAELGSRRRAASRDYA